MSIKSDASRIAAIKKSNEKKGGCLFQSSLFSVFLLGIALVHFFVSARAATVQRPGGCPVRCCLRQ